MATTVAAAADDKPFTFTARVPYTTTEHANIIKNALSVDPELRPEFVNREITVEGTTVILIFEAVDARTLRAAVGTFCDLLRLATETLEAFPPLQDKTQLD
jgi:EKC/KEOPS complex subunit PCC1/LAGE3